MNNAKPGIFISLFICISLLLGSSHAAFAQASRIIRGTVVNASNGNPLVGVSVSDAATKVRLQAVRMVPLKFQAKQIQP